MDKTFGELLKEMRREVGISQRSLAEKIGVDFSYISKLENNHLSPPAADTVIAICEVLEVPPEELLSFAGKIPTDVQKSVGESKSAQEFLREAQKLSLSDEEWDNLTNTLKGLREDK